MTIAQLMEAGESFIKGYLVPVDALRNNMQLEGSISQTMNRKNTQVHLLLSLLLIKVFLVTFLNGCASTPEVDKKVDKEMPELRFEYRIAPWYGFKSSACSVTFDDGTLDQYLIAFPELEERNIKATFFLITEPRKTGIWNDGSTIRLLFSWEQARTMAAAGHEIASHSTTHADFSGIH